MRTRSAAVELTWNGAAVKSKMLGQTTEITVHGSRKRRGGQPGHFDP